MTGDERRGGGADRSDVVVVGAFGVDTLVEAGPGASWDAPPRDWPDSTLGAVRDCVAHAGGYAARGYAALGLSVAALGHVGDDWPGRWVRSVLAADGVAVDGLFVRGSTARSVNVRGPGGARRSTYDPREDGAAPPDAATVHRLLRGARAVHCNIPGWAAEVVTAARRLGVPVVVDLQDAAGPDDAHRAPFVAGADLLAVSGARLADPEAYARWALSHGPARLVLVGLGARGCLVVRREGAATAFPALPDGALDGAGRPGAVGDTNGAGDSLVVGFVTAYLLEGRDLAESVLRGQLCARWCCTLRATSDGLLDRATLEALARADG